MSPPSRADHWRLHSALVVGLSICTLGFVVELRRGVDGHLLAWAYVVEWPLFAVVGTVMWWMLLHDPSDAADTRLDADRRPRRSNPVEEGGDDQLAAWNAYVARLHADETES